MLIDVKPEQAQLILGAMQQVATARRSQPLADADHTVLAAAHHYLFRATDDLDPATLPDTIPVVLGAALDDPTLADRAAQLLTAIALVGGTVDETRLAVVEDYGISL